MAYKLRSVQNPTLQIAITNTPTRIGRSSDNQLVLQDLSVSRQHAIVQMEGDVPVITDLKSGRGTFVNGVQVKRSPIKAGDMVLFGTQQFQVVFEPSAVPQTPPTLGGQPEKDIRRPLPTAQPPKKTPLSPFLWIGLAVILLAALIGGGYGIYHFIISPPEPTPMPTEVVVVVPTLEPTKVVDTPTEPPATEMPIVEPLPKGLVTNKDDVRLAVIRIEAQGTRAYPDAQGNVAGSNPNEEWSGSGFIIDPAGLAVTNNHVVAGAAKIEVYLEGESKPRNAKFVGFSECSDLALIQIDDLNQAGFYYLAWYNDVVKVTLPVYAAGYPGGEPQYTITAGVVSKDDAKGETYWASIDKVIEHDAVIDLGSSGGPLIDAGGTVVAVNYTGQKNVLSSSFFAISKDLARPIIDQLRMERFKESIGIAGDAYWFTPNRMGVWVYSVTSGSPAARAGVLPGDLIIKIENISVVNPNKVFSDANATLVDYCDVLRTHNSTDEIQLEVWRSANAINSYFCGYLNGAPLKVGRCP